MNPINQSGTHPDAESLTAFVEQSLSSVERAHILAHMAECSRCRQVVFLAQQATDAEQPTQVPVEKTAAGKTDLALVFGGWRWAWIPVAAMAGFVGFAVIVHHAYHSGPEEETARNKQQVEDIEGALSAKATKGPETRQPPKLDDSKSLSAVHLGSAAPGAKGVNEKESARPRDEKKAAEKDELKKSVDAMNAEVAVAGGAIHGTLKARAKSAMGGPMAQNQLQENYASQQNALAPGSEAYMANKPSAQAAPRPVVHPPETAESEVPSPERQASAAFTAPAPASQAEAVPAPQKKMAPVAAQSLGLVSDEIGELKAADVKLPSGLGALSVARTGQRTIAIDSAGTLYLSDDGGKHWQPVQTQWSGRAVLVKTTQQPATQAAVMAGQNIQFELVNDKLQTWVSADGNTWTEKTLPKK